MVAQASRVCVGRRGRTAAPSNDHAHPMRENTRFIDLSGPTGRASQAKASRDALLRLGAPPIPI
jgi:hypothetical protein